MITFDLLTSLANLLARPTINSSTPKLEMLIEQINDAYDQPGVAYLEQVLAGLGLISTLHLLPLADTLPRSALPYQAFIKPSCYQTMLAFCQLAYLMENNGIAADHAFKLATLFDTPQAAFAYLKQRANRTNPQQMLVHDACLFDLPLPDTCEFRQWQRLARVHLARPRFRELLPHAAALEAIGQLGRHAPQTPRLWTRQELRALKAEEDQVVKAVKAHQAKQRKAPVQPTIDERVAFDEEVQRLSQEAARRRSVFAGHCQGIGFNDSRLPMLEAFYHLYQSRASAAHQYLVHHGLTAATIATFYTLTAMTSDAVIPTIMIDGDTLDCSSYYLKKLGTSDEETAVAACLGKITNCCQYLGGVGHDCTVHGITSPYGGFYVICRGAAQTATLADPIVAQAWAWYSLEGILCLDSIEAKPNIDMVAVQTLFRALAHLLCQQHGIKQVNTGSQSGITKKIAHHQAPEVIAHCIDYTRYRDSNAQLLLAHQDMPYLFFDQTTTPLQTQLQHDSKTLIQQLLAASTPLQDNQSLQRLIAFSLSTTNQPLQTLMFTCINAERRAELTALIKVNRDYLGQLNQNVVMMDALNQGAYVHAQNNKGQSALHIAVLTRNQEALKTLMVRGIDGNRHDQYGNSALMLALEQLVYNQVPKLYRDEGRALATYLIDHGVDVDSQNNQGLNPLLLAVTLNDLAMARHLLDKGANVDIADQTMRTPLFRAVMHNKDAMVRLLLAYHPNINTVDVSQDTPLLLAVQKKYAVIVDLLLAQPSVQLHHQNQWGSNALHQAIYNYDEALAIRLIDNGAPIDQTAGKGDTALYWATAYGMQGVVASLLAHHANPNGREERCQRTPLITAVGGEQMKPAIVASLLACPGIDLEAFDDQGLTALNHAIKKKRLALVALLLKHGALVNSTRGFPVQPPLISAIIADDEVTVKQLLNYHAKLDSVDNYYHRTPLSMALACGSLSIINILLNQPNCPVDAKDKDGLTALHYAIHLDDETIIQRLLANGAAIDAQDNLGRTALIIAIQAKLPKKAIALLLAQPTIDLNRQDKAGFNALYYAIINGDYLLVHELLNAGIDSGLKDNQGRTALWWAVENKQEAITPLLLEKNVKCNVISKIEQKNLLMVALAHHQELIANHLSTSSTIMVNHQDNDGLTALHYAIRTANLTVVNNLIKRGVDFERHDNQGRTALWLAAALGKTAIVTLLLAKKAQLNSLDNTYQQTPFMAALRHQELATANLLLSERKIALHHQDNHGMTALHYAAKIKEEALVKTLLSKGVVVDIADKQGKTPLWWAVAFGNTANVALLLAQQAQPNLCDDESQQTPLIMALVKKHHAIAHLLVAQPTIELHHQDKDGLTALHHAIKNHDEILAQQLLDKSIDIECKDKKGRTVLWWAVVEGLQAIVVSLLAKQARPNTMDITTGQTALMMAFMQKHHAIARLLLAQPTIKLHQQDNQGLTLFHYSSFITDEWITQQLQQRWCEVTKNISVDTCDNLGRRPIFLAITHNNEPLLRLLLTHHAQVDITDQQGQTPLMIAVTCKRAACVALLLEQPAINMHHQLLGGATALDYAINNNDETIIKLLLQKGADKNNKLLFLAIKKSIHFFQTVFMLYPENERLSALLKSNGEKQPLFNEVVRNMPLLTVIITALPQHQRLSLLTYVSKHHDRLWSNIVSMPSELRMVLDSLSSAERLTALTIDNTKGETLVALAVYHAQSMGVILAVLAEPVCFSVLTMPSTGGHLIVDCIDVKTLPLLENKSAIEDYLVLYDMLKPFDRTNANMGFFASNRSSLSRLAQQVKQATSIEMVKQAVVDYVAKTPEAEVYGDLRQRFAYWWVDEAASSSVTSGYRY